VRWRVGKGERVSTTEATWRTEGKLMPANFPAGLNSRKSDLQDSERNRHVFYIYALALFTVRGSRYLR
jgi:hypothetical protein